MSFWRLIQAQIQQRGEFLKQSAAEGIGMVAVLWGLNKAGIIQPDTQHEKSFRQLHQTPDMSPDRPAAETQEDQWDS